MTETCDRSADENDGARELAENQPGFDMKNLTAETAEVSVTAGVSRAAEAMVRAVHLDDEPEGWGEEVGDGVAEDDLAAKRDAEFRA